MYWCLYVQRPIYVIGSFAALFIILALNHQSRVNVLAYSQDGNTNYSKSHSITFYDVFSDLSRNFTGTVDKFKHNSDNNDNNKLPQDSGGTRH
jgi:hypothetical protein